MSRQKARSEETKQAILAAAGKLFADRGYEAVTMREIAKEADCSHTTIYIYFKDKEALLNQLSMAPLQALQQHMEAALSDATQPAGRRLQAVCKVFIQFCLSNRNLYTVLFMAKASRVDEQDPALEVQQLRNYLFGLLRQAIAQDVQLEPADDRVLAYARILYFTLHGIISLYTGSDEPYDALMERLSPTFDLAVAVMTAGFKENRANGGDQA